MPMRMTTTVLAAVLSLSTAASASTVTIGGASDANIATNVKDATIFQNPATNSNGAGPGMFVGTNGSTSPRRGLIEFNVAGSVPAGATITDAKLTLYLGMTAGGGTGSFNIELHKLNAGWGEGTTESGVTSIGMTGNGLAANPGDATWGFAAYNTTSWPAGGDYVSGASATASVGSTANAASAWDSTGTIADVQSWLDNPSTNFGWELINTSEAAAQTFRAFWTKEATTAELRPSLTITYSVPEPAALALAGCGSATLLLLSGIQRRRAAPKN